MLSAWCVQALTRSFVCSLIMCGDSNQQDRFALQLYDEFKDGAY